ncbi:MAG: FAD-dependent oxidoreductase [Alphaproteobacteria bacterium]
MSRDPRYDILFEPVPIGPVVAKNRFYQPPHCNGMGEHRPNMHAAMREMKAEGGWAVIHTEHCSIHPHSDLLGEAVQTLWDDDDVAWLALMCDKVHKHGSLAGVQLAFACNYNPNRFSREVPMGADDRPCTQFDPQYTRAMDKADIRQMLGWWRKAAERSKRAGCEIVQVDVNFSQVAYQFLSPRNTRTDEYGGSVENRARLLREIIESCREGVKGDCAVTVRIIIDEMIGARGLEAERDGREIIECLAEVPDLWDVVVGSWDYDSRTSRFAPEAAHEAKTAFVKTVTTKPVVGVGRFTSPDTMVGQIKRRIMDMIGATRPSIADPFLPKKIEEGRAEDIRECIGCNICVSGHWTISPIRCTQNPTMGEEWRKGWHPETIAPKKSDDTVLVVGAGPAGLECARALGARGYQVHLAEASRELGGRVARECRLPGLAEWARVRDWRVGQIAKLPNVEIYRESRLTAEDVRNFGFNRVVIATGSEWRKDGYGRTNYYPIPGSDRPHVFTPEDLMGGRMPEGPVVVFDDDQYYMGSILAEMLAAAGRKVTIVSPASEVSAWSYATLETKYVAKRLADAGIEMLTHHNLVEVGTGEVTLQHVHSERERRLPAASVVMVVMRAPVASLYHELVADPGGLTKAGIRSVTRIGDCLAPGAIAHAVYSGHRYARELDEPPAGEVAFRRERPIVLRA